MKQLCSFPGINIYTFISSGMIWLLSVNVPSIIFCFLLTCFTGLKIIP